MDSAFRVVSLCGNRNCRKCIVFPPGQFLCSERDEKAPLGVTIWGVGLCAHKAEIEIFANKKLHSSVEANWRFLKQASRLFFQKDMII